MTFGVVASAHVPFSQQGWTDFNLLNSWVDFGSVVYDSPAYDTQGAVYTRGIIKSGTTTGGTVVADNLPAPTGTLISPHCITGSPVYAPAFADVNSSGEMLTRNNWSSTATYPSLGKYLPSSVSLTAPTLSNSWVDYGGAFEGAGYYKDSDGTVYLQGLIKDGTATNGTVLFTLPSGYRPSRRLAFAVASNNTVARVDVFANGEVQIISGSNTWLSLTGISFVTASTTAPTLNGGWVNYGGGTFADAGYYKDSNGIVHLTGLVKGGSTAANYVLMTLPSGYRPTNHYPRPTLTASGTAYIYVEADGEVKIVDQSATWFSLDGFSFSTTA